MRAKQAAHRFGMLAESFAVCGLRLKGYRILGRRFKTPVGEIDIIARRGNVIAFIEVKARGDLSTALQAVTPQMQNRIARAASWFIAQDAACADCTMRFDLIALAPPFAWRHLDNAWFPPA